jgi:tetratricopeptide (TPR) repeat protein
MTEAARDANAVQHRSLWQVLGGYAVASWVAYQVVLALREGLGLPDKIPMYALVLLALGLPVVVATWFVQRRMHATLESRGGLLRLFTWKRTLLGGVAAFAVLAIVTLLVMVLQKRSTLLAQGVIANDQPIVLADFVSTARDTTLGSVVTEALRVDLMQSNVIRLAQPAQIHSALARMQRKPQDGLSPEVARDLAEREGMKAVVEGDVKQAGPGYLITARIVAKDSIVVAIKEVAKDSTDFIPAVNRLSRELRSRAGESLKTIRAGTPLLQATTSSLAALRKYSEAQRVSNLQGDALGGVRLFEEAIALDSTFAMAWTSMGMQLNNTGIRVNDALHAITRAYELRDRLTERERYLAIASYEETVRHDLQESLDADNHVLAIDSTDAMANNNIGNIMVATHRQSDAIPFFRRAIAAGFERSNSNLAMTLIAMGRSAEGWAVFKQAVERYPDNFVIARRIVESHAVEGRLEVADSIARSIESRFTGVRTARVTLTSDRIAVAQMSGRLADAAALSAQYRANLAGMGLRADQLASLLRDAEVSLQVRHDRARSLREIDAALRAFPLESVPISERPYMQIALLYYGGADPARAEAMLTTGARLHATRSNGRFRSEIAGFVRAVGMLESGKPAAALPQLLRESELLACLNCKLDYVARAYDGAGMADSARATYERFLTRFPPQSVPEDGMRRAPAMFRLAELYDAAGNVKKAKEWYGEFVQEWAHADAELQPQVQTARKRLQR